MAAGEDLGVTQRPSTPVEVRPFRDSDAGAFAALNFAWIEQFFEVESKDREILENPRSAVLDPGGAIFVAAQGEEVVGAVAMVRMSETSVELAKMAVSEKARGLGVGQRLGEAVIAEARSRGYARVFLESHSDLQPALRLYRRLGFKDVKQCESPYARCDVQMEKLL